MPELEQAGNFRGSITSYCANEAESGAVAVTIDVAIEDIWHEGEWHDWRQHGFTVRGDIWVVKKDGSINDNAVRSLINNAGWDGKFESITGGEWEPKPVAVVVNKDEYKDQVRYRAAFINAYDSTPGGGNVSADDAKALDKKLGGQLRGIAGNAARNELKPPGKPTKKTAGKSSESPAPAGAASGTDDDQIPF